MARAGKFSIHNYSSSFGLFLSTKRSYLYEARSCLRGEAKSKLKLTLSVCSLDDLCYYSSRQRGNTWTRNGSLQNFGASRAVWTK